MSSVSDPTPRSPVLPPEFALAFAPLDKAAFGVGAGYAGFVFGWFAAFCRNLVLAASLLIIRSRAEREQTRDFLDHI